MKVEIGAEPRGPLAGVRVLDFTTVVSGPLCTQVFGDLGADVVKVEAPRGDSARRMGPPFRAGLGPVWVQFNSNKRAVVIDLQQPAGVAVARRIAALFARERSGRGQRIDVPMLDAYAAFALPDVLGPESFHPVEAQPAGMLTASNIHRTWKTADGHVVMMIVEDAQFHAICRALDREDLESDPRFAGLLARLGNGVALYGLLEVELAKWSTQELVEHSRRFGAPLAPVNGVREFMADPQTRANRTVFEVEDPRAGTLRQLAHPARYSETPATLRRLPPQLGEHTDEVLVEAGYRADEIRELRASGAVA